MELQKSPVVFHDDTHKYFLDGRELSGITSMLARQLFPNKYAGIDEATLAAATERGHKVHEDIELWDAHGFPFVTEEARQYVELRDKVNLRPIANEYLVNTEHHASMIDIVMHDADGNIVLADIKTTSRIDDAYLSWQLSCYAYMFELMNPGLRVSRLVCVWLPLPRYGTATIKDVHRIDAEHVEALLAADAAGETYTPPADLMPVVSSDALPASYTELETELLAAITLIKETEEHKKQLISGLEAVMRENGVKKWQTDRIILTIKADTTTERLDTKRLKEEQPEIYAQYIKTSPVKGGLLIKTR